MKKTKILFLFLLVILASNLLQAQINGFGQMSHPPSISLAWPTPPPLPYTLYTDDNRASVMGASFWGPVHSPKVGTHATLTLGIRYGGFYPGDEVLLIQSKGVNIGQHQNARVDSSHWSGPTCTLFLTSITPLDTSPDGFHAGYSTRSTNPLSRLQIIKIHNYYDFTLNTGGLVTCTPWNDAEGVGGICCFIVQNNFTINGGKVNVSGIGFTAQEAPGVIFQGPVSGQAPAPYNTFSASKGPVIYGCAGSMGTVNLSGTAQRGGSATAQTYNPAHANTGTGTVYGSPNYYHTFITGTPGYYSTGYGAGQMNAGGGGKGGNGANNTPCSTLGNLGLPGDAGSTGGASGIGGNGGGGIYIKTKFIYLNTLSTVFYANGANGSYGGEGGQGGAGGTGGAGGAGCTDTTGGCTNKWPGSYGGGGDWGEGGNGGDGGDGGQPGTIWLTASHINYGSTPFTNNTLSVRGGKGGLGGYYGWGGGNATPVSVNVPNQCDGTFCFDPPLSNCDPDPIICLLRWCKYFDSIPVVGHNNRLRFSVTPSIPTPLDYVEYDVNTGGLYKVSNSVVTNWVQVMDAAIAYRNFLVFGITMNNLLPASFDSVPGNCNPTDYTWYASSKSPLGYSAYNRSDPSGKPKFIVDDWYDFTALKNTPVYFTTCSLNEIRGGYVPGVMFPDRLRGRTGADVSDGTINLLGVSGSNANGVIGIGPPSPYFKTNTGLAETIQSISNLSVFPNPTTGDVWLSLNSVSSQTANIIVIDGNGREVYKQTIKLQIGENKQMLKLNGIAQGIYTLQLQTTNGKLTQQIIVN